MRQAKLEPLPTRARLAEFEILDILAEGDFGILYRSRDHILDRDIALREYFPASFALRDADGGVSLASERDEELFAIGLRGFIDEARLLARLEHPALMKVYRFWEANGTAYMAMPFHEGTTLRSALDMGRVGREEADIARLLADPLDALDLLHGEGRVHGGIAPATILLRPDGRGVLLDLGAASKTLANLALTPTAMLQPGFAALEQYEVIPGLKPGPWTDVYATAAVAYNLIYGMPPPDAETRSERDAMLPLREIGAGRYGEPFLAALDAALALMPQERTATAGALRSAFGIIGAATRAVGHAPMPDAPTAPYTERRVDATTAFGTQTLQAPPMSETPMRSAAGTGGMFAGPAATTVAADAPMAHSASAGAAVIGEAHAPIRRAAAPVRKSGKRIPETAFVLVIAAALYAGFRSLPSGDNGATPSAPAVVVSQADTPPAAGQSAQNTRNAPADARGAGASAAPAPATPSAPAAAPASTPSAPATASASAPAAAAAPSAPATASSAAPGATGTLHAPGTASAASAPSVAGVPRPALGLPAESRSQAAPATLAGYATTAQQARASGAAAADAAQRAEQRREETAWLSAQSIDTPGAYESFLAAYPDSSHAPTARVILARLRWEQRQAEAARTAQGAPRSEGAARAPQTQAAETREAPPVREAAPTRTAQASRVPDRIALARPPEAAPVTVAPAQQPAETATVDGKTIRLRGQTMTGDFTPDPVTGAVSGRGRIVWDNGDRFEGTLVRGVKEGRGEFVWANGQRYRGDFAGGLPNGRGSVQFPNGNRYEGDMRNGAPNGMGTIHFANGNRYTGEVRDGLPNGRGTNRFANGDTYSGTWRMGQSDGQGRYTWANGDVWEGEFRNGVKTANGRMVVAAHDRVGAVSGASSAGAGGSGVSSASDADDPFLK